MKNVDNFRGARVENSLVIKYLINRKFHHISNDTEMASHLVEIKLWLNFHLHHVSLFASNYLLIVVNFIQVLIDIDWN